MSPRRLDEGWSPASVTEYVYDEDGRLTHTVTATEPEFSPEDIALLIQARRDRDAPRGPHGHLISEATAKNADPASRKSTFKFVPRTPERDHAQHAINAAREAYRTRYPDADLSDLIFRVDRVPVEYDQPPT